MGEKYFSVLLPPPNLTGVLHLGHIWNATIQDFYIRKNKLIGDKKDGIKQVYWGNGFDHAGLSLQVKFESLLREKNIDFSSWSEEQYWKEINAWKDENKKTIAAQYESMGFLLDKNDAVYTMDEFSIDYTLQTFKDLYERGFIYQDITIVNWDTQLKTAISDAEVDYKDELKKLYFIKYQLVDDSNNFIEVATSRPETMFGDVALFVHPEDERYISLIGKKVKIPYIDRTIEIIADSEVDMNFGTGVLKCTPAHDHVDYKMSQKHINDWFNSPLRPIIAFNEDGIMTSQAKTFAGKHKNDVLNIIAADYKTEDYLTRIPYSQRSGGLIEPTISKQWFLSSDLLAKQCLLYMDQKKQGNAFSIDLFNCEQKVNIYPDNLKDNLRKYLENMDRWCISRQVKWGIQFPIYQHVNTGQYICSLENVESPEWKRITDRLDTWFTSALWPLIVVNKKRKEGLENYWPIDLLVTGRDILFFWVCKMMFMSVHIECWIPFKNIYLHGLILGSDGNKMSKSLNNGITPEELLTKHSKDTIRWFFISNTNKDHNIKYSEEKFGDADRFIHKIKNALHFFKKNNLMDENHDFACKDLNWYQLDFLQKFNFCIETFQAKANTFDLFSLSNELRAFVIDTFCGSYLELIKFDLKFGNSLSQNSKKFNSYIWVHLSCLLWTITPDLADHILKESFNKGIEAFKFEHFEKFASLNSSLNGQQDVSKQDQQLSINFFDHNLLVVWFEKLTDKLKKIRTFLNIPEKDVIQFSFVVRKENLPIFLNRYEGFFRYFEMNNFKFLETKTISNNPDNLCFSINHSENENFSCELLLDKPNWNLFRQNLLKEEKTLMSEVKRSQSIVGNQKFKDKDPLKYADEVKKLDFYKNDLYFCSSLIENLKH